ncbi:CUE domain-containing protein 1 isoform X1 [Caretta caretta]|uniref:CUE domain-containing protein 1 isoform X1 n=1 Tax=Caretta caretta TaxID=8467 RepID=UPI003F4C1738
MARDWALGGALVPQRGAWLRKSQGSCPWMLRLSLPAPPASSVPPAGRAGGARLHFRQPAARKPPGSPFPPGLERERSPCHFRGAPPAPFSPLPACELRGRRRAASSEPNSRGARERARARLSPPPPRLPPQRLPGQRPPPQPLSSRGRRGARLCPSALASSPGSSRRGSRILERTLEPDSSDEEPPPVYSPPAYDMHVFDRQYPQAPPSPPPRIDVPNSSGPQVHRRYRNWNPPLLGNLPDDFLRILPQQMDSVQSSQSCHQTVLGEGSQRSQGSLDQERKWKQYLEDERIALFLQNEEFMKELQRNRDFLLALERDRLKYESKKSKSTSVAVGNEFSFSSVQPGDVAPVTSEASSAVSEDALFRDKLKHMGKSTRKKLFELARAFSEKTKMKKSKRKHLLKHQVMGTAASTANLLDDVEGHSCDEDFQARRQQLHEEEERPKEGQ